MNDIRVKGVSGGRTAGNARPSRLGLHVLLSIQSGIVVLISINRLSPATTGYVAENEFLRWVDLNNLILALATLVTANLLIRHLEYDSPRRHGSAYRALGLAFFVGAVLYAISYGNHEVTNYLNDRFCLGASGASGPPSAPCEIVAYHDNELSHYLFFVGFTIVNVAIMLAQVVFPDERRATLADNALVGFNALFIAAGIVANLGFEEIGLDLYVVAAVTILAGYLLVRQPRQLILRYYAIAYVVGFAGAGVAQLA